MNELLDKYFAQTLTDSEKKILFREIEAYPELKEEFVRLQNIMALSGMMDKESDSLWVDNKMKELQCTIVRRKKRRISLSILKYSAVAVLFICTWFISKDVFLNVFSNNEIFVEVPKGERISLVLSDGTEVWLNSRSKIRVPKDFNRNNRIVELDGEGFFSVSKNEKKSFIVKTKQYNVEVTGTQFNVLAYSESTLFETDLVEGAVFLYKEEKSDQRLYLLPNEKAFYADGQLHKTISSFSQSQSFQNGIYSFEDMSLQELSYRLALWYDVDINIKDPEVAAYVFSGKFRQNDDIGKIIQAIKDTGKFNFRLLEQLEIEIY